MMKRLPLLLLLAACSSSSQPADDEATAYEQAGRVQLEQVEPEEYPGLHKVYRLSENIISGGEPLTKEALERIAKMGVKTLLSVDGKVPDAETAGKLGMRYVHLPLKYNGITDEEMMRVAKVFRELEGPFYVHCFHGQHRGPAAAAVGRLVCDGAPRLRAMAEMYRSGAKYEGLYQSIAKCKVPGASETSKHEWDFPSKQPLGGFRTAMAGITRHFDNLKMLAARDWKADPKHPDVDAVNEAQKLAGIFARASELDSVKKQPHEFREWMHLSTRESNSLAALLQDGKPENASKAMRVVKKTCGACHAGYRNE